MEIDQDDLRTGTATSSRASHEHYLRFLVFKKRALKISTKASWSTFGTTEM